MTFSISTEKEKLELEEIYNFISKESYWGHGRTESEFRTTVDHSFCFGMYDQNNKQIGFARVVTDFVVFAYIMDMIILTSHQGNGLGKELLQAILSHKDLKKIKTFALKTKNAHEFYYKFGFQAIAGSNMWMAKDTFEYQ